MTYDFTKGMKATNIGYAQFMRVTDVAKSLVEDIKGSSRYNAVDIHKDVQTVKKY